MSWVQNIQAAIDFIERHLEEDINLDAVGRAINYAPSSFQNLFSAVTGYSIGEYIRFRRLSLAADELEQNDITVSEAAVKYGYDTVEAFSKAFKRLFGCSPSKYSKTASGYKSFSPITIQFRVNGGFCMTRNLIPNVRKVDWSDTLRQSEYVNSVVSALNANGENLGYDYVCAVSGSAFRTSFSLKSACEWNHGNYHVIHTPIIIDHTFRMLGYRISRYSQGDYGQDKQRIIDSIDRGSPVITLEGVINHSDACVISGYDHDGAVLLGYNPFMDVEDDHQEEPDETGHFRKSDWHNGALANNNGQIIIIEDRSERLSQEAILQETLLLIKRLIKEENLAPDQHNGLTAHRAFVNALQTYEWTDNYEPYLNVMCNYKQYLDRQYAVPFFRMNGREDLADCYVEIADLAQQMGRLIPQDFTASDLFTDKENLKPYGQIVMQIHDLELKVLELIG
jgi:AraC-like DNA-binding protein